MEQSEQYASATFNTTENIVEIGKHPIDRDAAILPTKPLEELVYELREWLDSRITGGIVWGHQRMGKNQAIRYLLANGEELLGCPIPMGLFSAWDPEYTSLTENRFFGELLSALDYAAPRTGTAATKRKRIIDLIKDRVAISGDYRFMLFIDEAQWLANVQLRYFMDLHNLLKILDITLICVLVGQPELMRIRAELRNTKQAHLLGRFMSASHQFKGICSEDELRRITYNFDEETEYPSNSGISYTQHYVPLAYSNGWRLESAAPVIWKQLDRVLEDENLPSCSELPMAASMALIVWLLHQLSGIDSPELVLDPIFVEEGIIRRSLLAIKDHLELIA